MKDERLKLELELYVQSLQVLEDADVVRERRDKVDLEDDQPLVSSSDFFLSILTNRDRIQSILDSIQSNPDISIDASDIEILSQKDEILKKNQVKISSCLNYAIWKNTLPHNLQAWWWNFEVNQDKWFSRANGISKVLSLLFITISLGLMGDITPRFLLGNPDSFSATAASIQSVLTLLTVGSTLTEQGKNGLKSILAKSNLPEKYWHEFGAGASCLLMLGFLGIQKSLPVISNQYADSAQLSRKNGDWGTAEEHLKRALYLNTDNAEAQFRLGNLYEDLQQFDQSRTYYQLAFQGGNLMAGNNLARLYIRKKEPSSAISLLLKIKLAESLDPKLEHIVRKNIGWARLIQKNYSEAKAALLDSIDLESKIKLEEYEIAPSHCLMAQVLDDTGDKNEALKEWSTCNENANPSIPEQDEWMVLAQKRLAKK
jgi:tetratricopeptide (TPR) repeat protein